jgi:hypothetical protein
VKKEAKLPATAVIAKIAHTPRITSTTEAGRASRSSDPRWIYPTRALG